MRIISGKFKGRRFHPPAKKWPTRPTTDISKEGLFNILSNRLDFESIKMLDLFGGTGNHCYEFISRGCKDATYVDKFPGCVNFVKKIARELEIEPFLEIRLDNVFRFIKSTPFNYDYIFAGPPYGLPQIDSIPDLIFEFNLLKENGLFIMEHNPNHQYEDHPSFEGFRTYGKTVFSFFS